MIIKKYFYILLILLLNFSLFSISYADKLYTFESSKYSFNNATDSHNIKLTSGGSSLTLIKGAKVGYIVFPVIKPETLFNEVLPSWNGFAPLNEDSSFKIQMRFDQKKEWSPWVTVGYWKNNIWENYGLTEWSGGIVDIDFVKLKTYSNSLQFKILMMRKDSSLLSPTLSEISLFLSDSKTTSDFNIEKVLIDNPAPINIETSFKNQYKLDSKIGGTICSPVMSTMILESYDVKVDPLLFSENNKDPYWGIYGVWPRSVQNASQVGLKGYVSRYRNWSDTREVLAKGGRIGISVGPPLYKGHLMMLAGFDKSGNPLVHDSAKEDGYFYKFDKTDLSKAWFNKGGIAYTFYPID
ncbi:MAG: hypothetical protein OCD02_05890 [Spirochaetaceae bacterium]